MTKIALFPWCGTVIKTAKVCELMPEQSGFLTGSTFLPWRSLVIPGDEYTSHIETFDETCGGLPLQHTEGFNISCGGLNEQHIEEWEN